MKLTHAEWYEWISIKKEHAACERFKYNLSDYTMIVYLISEVIVKLQQEQTCFLFTQQHEADCNYGSGFCHYSPLQLPFSTVVSGSGWKNPDWFQSYCIFHKYKLWEQHRQPNTWCEWRAHSLLCQEAVSCTVEQTWMRRSFWFSEAPVTHPPTHKTDGRFLRLLFRSD